ncbi:glycosyltransferase [Flavobacterium sp. MC2016-06]|uniref:glycosyltransferase n=1 Tax=Flavobacterium sp. MC2016-06 TaxID=2676308 RepID=UPI0012BABC11|nr:glycosyltransferase [Flavobacterium sp. MC2016-06]MBU3858684.1 glycosyltransferase [Flavobacterium sp. MC2016-06]
MRFAIISHVIHVKDKDQFFGYAPYVREMNIWLKYIDELIIVAPLSKEDPTAIDFLYTHHKAIDFRKVSDFSFTSFKNNLISIFKLPLIFWKIFWAMKNADHIHLRCPGNMGLIGCLVQILFPSKIKTAKYAGNWDSKSKQPWTYRLQKYILSNTFLTRNIQVLVYGEWKHQSKNIVPFFTATYSESEKEIVQRTGFNLGVKFIFVGSLSVGKNPLYAIKLVEELLKNGKQATLDLYGDGSEKKSLEEYIQNRKLKKHVILKGNQDKETIKKAYQESHFVILPSKSEGWPKAIAEGMFWGCVPVATKISCVPSMLDYGKRGILLEMNLNKDLIQIEQLLLGESDFFSKSKLASNWSQNYTTDVFEAEIKKLIKK